MSNFQNLVMAPTQSGPSNQCLTGCMYQIVQSPGAQGKNVLHLVPLMNAKDNPTSLASAPVITNSPVMNLQPQSVRFSVPTSVANAPLPSPINAKLVQQLGSTNYIITTQKNPAEVSKSIRVDNQLVTRPPNTAVLLDKPPLNLPSNPQAGAPSFFIMNTKPSSVPMKAIPIFPSSHSLQIPPHAEMKAVPASSLPFSIQQRILPPTSSSTDSSKVPSVIYVSPVNAVKTPPNPSKPYNPPITTTTPSPLLTPMLVPAVQSAPTTPPKGPLKWVVQENTESVIPVKSSSETQSQLLTLMAGAKADEPNLPASAGSNPTQLKESTLVMCNNKFYFLTKQQGSELKSPIQIKQEPPEKIPLQMGQGDDLANKVVEVVLSKNNLSSPSSKQTLNSPLPATSPPKPIHTKPSTPPPPPPAPKIVPTKKIPEVIYIDDTDDDDDDVVVAAVIPKPQGVPRRPPNKPSPAKVFTPSAFMGGGSLCSENQNQIIRETEAKRPETAKSPVAHIIDDRTLRAKFGLFKQEKIILTRIPLLPEGDSDSDADEDVMVQEKRMSDFSDTSHILKRRKSENDSGFSITAVTTDHSGHFWSSSPPLPPPPPAPESSDVREKTSAETTCTSFTETNSGYADPGTLHSAQGIAPEVYTDPSDSPSCYISQDITGHFSEVPLPRQRFHIESSASYPDETSKDEKIQRLKEVLKEREQALEALRRQKWS